MEGITIPSKWNTWKVIELIGEGSCSEVYHARDRISGRDAALKIITIEKTSLSEEKFIANVGLENLVQSMDSMDETFFRKKIDKARKEIEILDQLKEHSNIVALYDYEIVTADDQATIYILMEYLQDLWAWFDLHPLSEDSVKDLGIQICKALEFCEGKNIFHQDIKPENILVSKDGTYKLTDFSASDIKDEKKAISIPQGTMLYMAPESISDQKYTKRSEVYALGLVLYQLANKKCLPFMDQKKGVFIGEDFKKTIELRCQGLNFDKPTEVSENLGSVILKACAYKEQERYPSVIEFRGALESCKNQPDIIAETMPFTEDSQSEKYEYDSPEQAEKHKGKTQDKKNSKKIKIAGIGIIAAIIVGIAGISIITHGSKTTKNDTEIAETTETSNVEEVQVRSVEETKVTSESVFTESQLPEEENSPSSRSFVEKDAYLVSDYIFDGDCKITYIGSDVYECPDEYYQPAEGNKFIEFDLLIENLSDTEMHQSWEADYTCYAEGNYCSKNVFGTQDYADLAPGRAFHAKLVYEVPADSQIIILEYDPKHNYNLNTIRFVYMGTSDPDYVEEEHRIQTDTSVENGSSANLENATISIKKVNTEVSPESGYELKPGHHLISVTYSYQNTGSKDYYAASRYFSLCADGYYCNDVSDYSDISKTIPAGTTMDINVTYEVPDNASCLEVDYFDEVGFGDCKYLCSFAL